jgi:hypothetical protein
VRLGFHQPAPPGSCHAVLVLARRLARSSRYTVGTCKLPCTAPVPPPYFAPLPSRPCSRPHSCLVPSYCYSTSCLGTSCSCSVQAINACNRCSVEAARGLGLKARHLLPLPVRRRATQTMHLLSSATWIALLCFVSSRLASPCIVAYLPLRRPASPCVAFPRSCLAPLALSIHWLLEKLRLSSVFA